MPPPVLLVWYDKVNYMYGSIERLFHASSSIVSLIMTKLITCMAVLSASSMSPPVLLVWYDKVNYMYGSIERLFHASCHTVLTKLTLSVSNNIGWGSIERLLCLLHVLLVCYTKLITCMAVLSASSMPPPVLLVWYDKVNYMYGSIERLFHVSSSIVSLIWQS